VPQGTTVTVSFSDGPEQVPDVVGMKQADAEKAIRDAGFQPDVVESSSTTEPKGTVIQQSPKPGQTAAQGSTVTILVSSFEAPSESPSPTTSSPSPTPPLPSGSPTLPPSGRTQSSGLPPGRATG
jgi:serine/threonine-protein kinase